MIAGWEYLVLEMSISHTGKLLLAPLYSVTQTCHLPNLDAVFFDLVLADGRKYLEQQDLDQHLLLDLTERDLLDHTKPWLVPFLQILHQ